MNNGHAEDRVVFQCPGCGQMAMVAAHCARCLKKKQYIRMRPRDAGKWVPLELVGEDALERIAPTAWPTLAAVLGGGFALGATVLTSGPPGAGKTTLALLVAEAVAAEERRALYISTEMTLSQLGQVAKRLGIRGRVSAMYEEQLEDILEALDEYRPEFLVLDSLQLVRGGDRGPVGVMTELVEAARALGTASWILCHETKADEYAGPRTLEHLVDVMMRVLRTEVGCLTVTVGKNRYGRGGILARLSLTPDGVPYDAAAAK